MESSSRPGMFPTGFFSFNWLGRWSMKRGNTRQSRKITVL
jgi:hypothetical protein